MGFTPELLGLEGERVTAKFREPRDGCPHKGLDISSSKKPKAFKAGVFGMVVSPQGGPWGTLTVSPFSSPTTRIQYLHCSRISQPEGYPVAPWTEVGSTGEVAPPGTPITGIHLHLQVQGEGDGPEDCWQKRNFLDPEKWEIKNTLIGNWIYSDQVQQGNLTIYRNSVYHIVGTEVGNLIGHDVIMNVHRADGCKWFLNTYFDGRVVDRSEFGIRAQFPKSRDAESCMCGQCLRYEAPAHHTTIAQIKTDTISDGDGTLHKKAGTFERQYDTAAIEIPPDSIRVSMAHRSLDSIAWAVRAQLENMSLDAYYGVLNGETF